MTVPKRPPWADEVDSESKSDSGADADPYELADQYHGLTVIGNTFVHWMVHVQAERTARERKQKFEEVKVRLETFQEAAKAQETVIKDKLQPGRPRVRSLDAVRRDAATGVAISGEEVLLLGGCIIDAG